jgi:hypothetical protein
MPQLALLKWLREKILAPRKDQGLGIDVQGFSSSRGSCRQVAGRRMRVFFSNFVEFSAFFAVKIF